jgi:hypothetical protein
VKGSAVVSPGESVRGRAWSSWGEFLAGADEADLQAVDLAEPAFAAGFRDAGVEVVADLDQSRALDGVGLRQRTC